jgi:hypothetical protein
MQAARYQSPQRSESGGAVPREHPSSGVPRPRPARAAAGVHELPSGGGPVHPPPSGSAASPRPSWTWRRGGTVAPSLGCIFQHVRAQASALLRLLLLRFVFARVPFIRPMQTTVVQGARLFPGCSKSGARPAVASRTRRIQSFRGRRPEGPAEEALLAARGSATPSSTQLHCTSQRAERDRLPSHKTKGVFSLRSRRRSALVVSRHDEKDRAARRADSRVFQAFVSLARNRWKGTTATRFLVCVASPLREAARGWAVPSLSPRRSRLRRGRDSSPC